MLNRKIPRKESPPTAIIAMRVASGENTPPRVQSAITMPPTISSSHPQALKVSLKPKRLENITAFTVIARHRWMIPMMMDSTIP